MTKLINRMVRNTDGKVSVIRIAGISVLSLAFLGAFLWIGGKAVKAASASFTQGDWSGGTAAWDTPATQPGWTKYVSKDAGIAAGANIQLQSTSYSALSTSDDGVTDTCDAGICTMPAGFDAGTATNTYVAGTGEAAAVTLDNEAAGAQASNFEDLGGVMTSLFHLDENGEDATGIYASGTKYGVGSSYSTATKKFGTASLNFTDASDYVEFPDESALNLSQGTISVWVNQTSNTGKGFIFIHIGPSDDRIYLLHYAGSSQVHAVLGTIVNKPVGVLTPGEWAHLALTWDHGNYVTYFNGNVGSSGTYVEPDQLASYFRLGNNNSDSFNGFIDELSIYNRALTASEIAVLANGGGYSDSGTFESETIDLGGAYGINTLTVNQTIPAAVTAKGVGEETASTAAGLVALWRMNEATSGDVSTTANAVLDASGNGYHGTFTNVDASVSPTTEYTAGKLNGAIQFDGVDDYVNIGNVAAGIKSVVFWVKRNTYASDEILELNGTTSITISGGAIVSGGFNTPIIYVNGNPSSATLKPGWNHVAVVETTGVNASAVKLGIVGTNEFDGILDEVALYNTTLTRPEIFALYAGAAGKYQLAAKDTDSFVAGDYIGPDGTTETYFKLPVAPGGPTDAVANWNFDETTNGSVAVNATIADSSGNGYNGTFINGNASSSPTTEYMSGKFYGAIKFDGTDDYVVVNDNDALEIGTGDFSISIWFKKLTGTIGNERLLFHGALSDGDPGYCFWIGDTTVYIGVSNGTTRLSKSTAHAGVNNWTHLVVVVDRAAGTARLYINNADRGTLDISAFAADDINKNGDLRIGSAVGGYYFTGIIDDVAFYNRTLSAAEVAEIYNSVAAGEGVISADLTEIAALENKQYIRYKAYLETANGAYTPQMDDVTINFNGYSTAATQLVSSAYDSGAAGNFIKQVKWVEDNTGLNGDTLAGTVTVQVGTDDDYPNGGSFNFVGSSFTNANASCTNTGVDPTTCTVTLSLSPDVGSGRYDANNDRWFGYIVKLTSATGAATPTVDDIEIVYDTAHLEVFADDGSSSSDTMEAGTAYNVTVKVLDSSGNIFTGHDSPPSKTFALTSSVAHPNKGGCTSSFTTSGNTVHTGAYTISSGVATIPVTVCDATVASSTISAAVSLLATTAPLTISDVTVGTATQVAFSIQPSSAVEGGVDLATSPVVEIRDMAGNVVTTDSTTITLTAYTNSGCSTPALGSFNSTSLGTSSGVATFSNVNYDTAETIYIKAAGGSLAPACSEAVAVSAGAPSRITLTAPGTAVEAGAKSDPFTINVFDAGVNASNVTGNTVFDLTSNSSQTYNFYTYSGTCGSTALSPAQVTVASGTSSVQFCYDDTLAGTPSITATYNSGSDAGLTVADTDSASITVNPAAASKLQVLLPGETAVPGSATGKTGTVTTQVVDTAFNVTVNAVDANWNLVSSVTDQVTVTTPSDPLDTHPSPAALVNGTGTFSVDMLTSGSQTVTATDTTPASPVMTAGTSSAVTLNPLSAVTLEISTSAFNVGAGQTAGAVTVQAKDKHGNIDTNSVGTVTLSSTSGTMYFYPNLSTANADTYNGIVLTGNGSISQVTLSSGTADFYFRDTAMSNPTHTITAKLVQTATQTSHDGSSDTPNAGGFNAGTPSNTTVTGSGTGASVRLAVEAQTWVEDAGYKKSAGEAYGESDAAMDSLGNMHVVYSTDFQNIQYTNNSSGSWSTPIVLGYNVNMVGSPQIVIDSSDKIHVVFYQAYYQLMYRNNVSGSWSSPVTVGASVGNSTYTPSFSAMAIDSNNKLHIASWGNGTPEGLIYTTNESGTWVSIGVGQAVSYSGGLPDIAIDSNNKVHIVHSNNGDNSYQYATNASGSWVNVNVTPANAIQGSASQASIAVNSNNVPYIAYNALNQSPFGLVIATNASGSWVNSTIISGSLRYGVNSSIAIDSNDKIHVAHFNNYSPDFRHYYSTNASGSWVHTPISDTSTTMINEPSTTLILDSGESPHVFYYERPGTKEFHYASIAPNYFASGTFTSAVMDLGAAQNVGIVSWNSTEPANTTLTAEARAGNVATPDGTWTSWTALTSGADTGSTFDGNQYIQYKATLGTSDTTVTPTLDDITINYTPQDTQDETINVGSVNAGQSTITADSASVTVDNPNTITFTITARDQFGNPISGIAAGNVVVAATPTTGNTLTQPTTATDASGQTTATLSSTKAEQKTVTVTISGVGITDNEIVTFNPGIPHTNSTIAFSPDNVVADGSTTTTVTVTALDQYSNPIPSIAGGNISVTVGGTGNSLGSFSTTNSSGQATATLSSTKAETKTLTLNSINGISDGSTADVTFIAGAADHLVVTSSTATPTAGTAFSVTITAKDANENTATTYDPTGLTFTFSGPGDAPDTTSPSYADSATIIAAFSNGVAANLATTLYKAETVDLDISDGTLNSAGSVDYDVELTVGPESATHLTVTSSTATPTAGTAFNVVLSAKDDYENIDTNYDPSGLTFTFSGPGNAPDSTAPSYSDSATIIAAFTSGVTSNLATTLYKAETVELEISDGTLVSTGDAAYDADLTVAPESATHLTVTPSTTTPTAGTAFNVVLNAKDDYENVDINYDPSGLTFTFSGPGNAPDSTAPSYQNSAAIISAFSSGATSNLATTLYKAETVELEISDGTLVSTGDAAYDADLTVAPESATHLTVTPSTTTPTAGTAFNVVLSAKDDYENIDTNYNPSGKTYTFSGPGNAPDSTAPSYQNSAAVISAFSSGATSNLATTLYKAESVELEISDGSINSTGDAAYDADLVIGEDVPSELVFTQQPSSSTAEAALTTQPVIEIRDQYANLSDTGADATLTVTLTAVNPSTQVPMGGTLANNSVAAVGGVATFSGVSYNLPQQIKLKADTTGSGGAITGLSNTIVITGNLTLSAPSAQVTNQLYTAGGSIPTDIEFAGFTLVADAWEPVNFSGLTMDLNYAGAGMADADVTNFRLYKDTGTTIGTYDGSETLIDTGSLSSGTVTFTGFTQTINTTSISYLVIFDMTTSAVGGETIATTIERANITAAGNITFGSIIPIGSDVTGPTHSVGGVMGLANPTAQPANSLVGDGGSVATNNELVAFKLTASGEQMDVSDLVVNLTYGGGMAGKASGFKIYVDTNTNGLFDPGIDTTQIEATTVDLAGPTLTFIGLTMPVAVGSTEYLIIFDTTSGTLGGDSITASIDPANFTTTGNSSGNPITTSGSVTNEPTHTITGTLTLANATQPSNNLKHLGGVGGTDLSLFAFNLAAVAEQVNITDVVIDLTFGGNMDAADVSSFDLYQDVNGNQALDVGTDLALATGASVSGTQVTFSSISANNAVAADSNKNYLVVFDLASSATAADTIIGAVTTANITVQGNTSGVTIPLSGSNVTGPTHKVSGALSISAPTTQVNPSLNYMATSTGPFNELVGFKLSAVDEAMNISVIQLAVNYGAGMADGDLKVFGLYEDNGTIGTYESGTDVEKVINWNATAGGSITLTPASPISLAANTSKHYIVTCTLFTNGVAGETVSSTVSAANITATGAVSSLSITPTGSNVTGPTHTVTGKIALSNPTTQIANTTLSSLAGVGATDINLVSFNLAAVGEQMNLSQIAVNLSGTMDLSKTSNFDLYKGATPVQTGVSPVGNTVTFNSSLGSLAAGTNSDYTVKFDLDSTAVGGETITAAVSSSNITSAGNTSGISALVASGDVDNEPTQKASGTLALGTNATYNPAAGVGVYKSQETVIGAITLTGTGENITLGQFALNFSAVNNATLGAGGDLTAFHIYKESNATADGWDASDLELLSTGAVTLASGAVNYTPDQNNTLTAGTATTYYITVDGSATLGASEGISVSIASGGQSATGAGSSLAITSSGSFTGNNIVGPGDITGADVVLTSDLTAGGIPVITISSTLTNNIPASGRIEVGFPTTHTFTFGTVQAVSSTIFGNSTPVSASVSGNTVTIPVTSGFSSGTFSDLVLSGVTNPGVSGDPGVWSITTVDSSSNIVDKVINVAGTDTITARPFTVAPSISFTDASAGATDSATIGFTPFNLVPAGGKVRINFPTNVGSAALGTLFDLSAVTSVSESGSNGGVLNGIAVSGTNSEVLTFDVGSQIAGGTALSFTLTDVKNPGITGTLNSFTVATLDSSSDTIGSGTIAAGETISAGVFSPAPSVALGSVVAGATANATVTFTTTNIIPADGDIQITFPTSLASGFTLSSVTVTEAQGDGGTLTVSDSSNVLTINCGSQVNAGTLMTLTLSNLKNPEMTGTTGTYALETQSDSDVLIDRNSAVAATSIVTAGSLSSTNVQPASLVVGTTGNVTVTFTTANPVPANGVIKVTFPSGFSLGAVAASSATDIGGTLTTTVSGQVVTITRSGGSSVSGTVDDLILSNITNPTVIGSAGTYTIGTYASDGTTAIDFATVTADSFTGEFTSITINGYGLDGTASNSYWPVGRQGTITWSTTDSSGANAINDVKIEYATDNDSYATWATLVASTPDDGSFTWTPDETNYPILTAASGNPQTDRTDGVKIRITDVTNSGAAAVTSTIASPFTAFYHKITWQVKNLAGSFLQTLSVAEPEITGVKPEWTVTDFSLAPSPQSFDRYYPYYNSTYVSTFTERDGNGTDFSTTKVWQADKDKTVSVLIDTDPSVSWSVKSETIYDYTTNVLRVTTWLERKGLQLDSSMMTSLGNTTAEAATVDIYDSTGTSVIPVSATNPLGYLVDASYDTNNGSYWFSWDTNTDSVNLAKGEQYLIVATVYYSSQPYTASKTFTLESTANYDIAIDPVYDSARDAIITNISLLQNGSLVTDNTNMTLSSFDVLDATGSTIVAGAGEVTTVTDSSNAIFHTTWDPAAGLTANTMYTIKGTISYKGNTYSGVKGFSTSGWSVSYTAQVEAIYDSSKDAIAITAALLKDGTVVTDTANAALSYCRVLDTVGTPLDGGGLPALAKADTGNVIFHVLWDPSSGLTSNTAYTIVARITYKGTVYSGLKVFSTGDLGAISSSVAGLGVQMATVDSNISSVTSTVSGVGTNVSNVLSRLGGTSDTDAATTLFGKLAQVLTSTNTTLPARIAAVKTDIGTVSTDISTVQSTVSAIPDSLSDVQSTTSAVLGQVSGISSDVTNIATAGDTLTQASATITSMSSQFSIMEAALSNIDTTTMEESMNKMEVFYSSLKSMSEKIKEMSTIKIQGFDEMLEMSTEQSGDVKYLKNKTSELKAMMELNQKMVENVAKEKTAPVTQTWFEFY